MVDKVTGTHEDDDTKSIHEILSLPILLTDRIIKSTHESECYKPEYSEIARQVNNLSHLLRSLARLTTTNTLYDRPIRRVAANLTKSLNRALTLTHKCRHKKTTVLRHVLSITTATDFKKVSALLDSSLADMKWLLSIYSQNSSNNDIVVSLPPIAASNDPVLAWIWSYLAAVQSGRAEGANELANLARDNGRYRMMIVEENGVPPLLKLLKESVSVDAKNAAACALFNLADCYECVCAVASGGGVQVIAKAIVEGPVSVRVTLVDLVARMAEMDVSVQEEFGRENVTRQVVSLLGMDVSLDELKESKSGDHLHSLLEANKEIRKKCSGGSRKEEREVESSEVKLRLKESCALAMWKLARGSLTNSKKITETKALLVLAKIIEKERGDLQMNCLMVVMELAAVAQSNADLRRAAFKPNTPAAKAVLDQLLRVVKEETSASLVTPAIKAIGCLARVFPAKETRIIEQLVAQLGHRSSDVASEAAKALVKFVCDDNFNCKEHSKAIIEFNGVPRLMKLLRSSDRGQSRLHELVLLCNLAINIGNSKSLEQARALSVLEGAARHVIMQHPNMKELFAKAINQLTLYQAGSHTHRQELFSTVTACV